MIIVFHLDKFDRFGKNNVHLILSTIWLQLLTFFVGYRSLLQLKTKRVSRYFDKSIRDKSAILNSGKNMGKSGNIGGSVKSSAVAERSILAHQTPPLERRKTVMKTQFNFIVEKTIGRSLLAPDSEYSEVDLCIVCCKHQKSYVLLPCMHGDYCKVCAMVIKSEEGKCRVCGQEITEVQEFMKDEVGDVFLKECDAD